MKFFTKIINYVKDVFNPMDVYSSQRLLLNCSLIYGLIPYKLIKKQGIPRLETSVFGFIAAIVYMLFFGACFLATIFNQMNLMEFFIQSPISSFGGNLNLITSFVSITSVYLSSLYLRKKLKRMLAILTGIDERLLELGVQVNHKNALIFNLKSSLIAGITFFLFTISSMAFLIQTSPSAEHSRFSVIVTHFLPYFVITALVITFLNFARMIYTRFEATNKVSLLVSQFGIILIYCVVWGCSRNKNFLFFFV